MQDDGCGFAVGHDVLIEGRGFGLKNITERARTMGAKCVSSPTPAKARASKS
jgi:signal transduction histidine kinase